MLDLIPQPYIIRQETGGNVDSPDTSIRPKRIAYRVERLVANLKETKKYRDKPHLAFREWKEIWSDALAIADYAKEKVSKAWLDIENSKG